MVAVWGGGRRTQTEISKSLGKNRNSGSAKGGGKEAEKVDTVTGYELP